MIEEIREKIQSGRFEFSKHAVDQSIIRHVAVKELREAGTRVAPTRYRDNMFDHHYNSQDMQDMPDFESWIS